MRCSRTLLLSRTDGSPNGCATRIAAVEGRGNSGNTEVTTMNVISKHVRVPDLALMKNRGERIVMLTACL
jgi:hypothetical protein